MTSGIERNPTEYYTVVGGLVGNAYVAEDHAEHRAHQAALTETQESGVASLWLLFYAAIIGITLFAESGAGKLISTASLIVKN